MKVRHKKSGLELEVRPCEFASLFYEASNGCMIRRDDTRWEVVQEEEWEDVTRVYTATHLTLTYQCEPTDKITKIDGMHNGPAFIIERKKS